MLYPQQNSCRSTSSLDGVWNLRFEWDADAAKGWENGFAPEKKVAVPSSFNDLYTSYSERNHWGHVWYGREFEVPDFWRVSGRRVVLRVGSAAYSAEVWLNGVFLGSHETGYTPFEFDITEKVVAGLNRFVLRINTRLTPDSVPQGEIIVNATTGQFVGNHPPGNFDFYPYGGIHRPVVIYTTGERYMESILVDTSVNTSGDADVVFRIQAGGAVATGERVKVVIEESGESAEALLEGGSASVTIRVKSARIWDIGKPELYHARIELVSGGAVADVYRQRFGVRTVRIDGEKFLLNGSPVYFKGFGKHEDFFLIGKGLNDAVNIRDFELMKWVGANSFRTSHYPYAEEVLDLADEMGFLVISESPCVSLVPDQATEKTLATHCAVMREFMLRDYNHPSVVVWCIANEPLSFQEKARPYFEKVVAASRAVDTSRPLMLVTCFGDRDTCLDLVDIIGVNAYPGWYGGGAPFTQNMNWFKGFLNLVRERAGGRPMMMTEFGADCVQGFHMLPSELWTEDYQRDLLKEIISVIRSTGFIIGEHIWAFSDFRTGQNHMRALGNRKGVFTRDRQPKMAAYFLRDIWQDDANKSA